MAPTRSIRAWRWNRWPTGARLSARAGPADLPPDRRPVLLPAASTPYLERDDARSTAGSACRPSCSTGASCARRFPQIDFDGIEAGLYEPRFGALMARRAVQTLVAEFVRAGGDYRQAQVAPPAGRGAAARRDRHRGRRDDRAPSASSSPAAPGSAELFPGPARPPHLPDPAGGVLLRARRRATTASSPAGCPAGPISTAATSITAFPTSRAAASRSPMTRTARRSIPTPATAPRRPRRSPTCAPSWRAASRALAGRPLSEARVCQYENSSNGDFLIDRHPRWENVRAGRRRLGPRLQARPRGRPLCRRSGCSARSPRPSPASRSPPRARSRTARCIRRASGPGPFGPLRRAAPLGYILPRLSGGEGRAAQPCRRQSGRARHADLQALRATTPWSAPPGDDEIFGLGGNDGLLGLRRQRPARRRRRPRFPARRATATTSCSAATSDDYLDGGDGDDLLDGGAGLDRAAYSVGATAGVTVDLNIVGVAQNTGQGIDTLIGIEHVSGTRFDDVLTGDGGDNWIWGGSDGSGVTGNDILSGGGGNDLDLGRHRQPHARRRRRQRHPVLLRQRDRHHRRRRHRLAAAPGRARRTPSRA